MQFTNSDFHSLIQPLGSQTLNLENAGGKGANLARLIQAGFHVTGGFAILTQAYRDYLQQNNLTQSIQAELAQLESAGAGQLENCAAAIQGLFTQADLPETLKSEIRAAYQKLDNHAVAVRSSATTEDLPEASFAGQQDTYLNVQGEEALFKAVQGCWASLWNARAIDYRRHNHIPQLSAAIAVVVQEMVESQASGVLFTANPLNGIRTETVIDATLGLGEALVSGQVEPDHFVIDTTGSKILSRTLGAKKVIIQSAKGGGTKTSTNAGKDSQAISDAHALKLARLGQQVAEHFGIPQDIEWAIQDEQLFLLQARPITTLYPLPQGLPAEPLKVLFSFAAIQGVLAPLTPLGMDTLKLVFATGAELFNIKVDQESQTILYEAGQRLWVNFTPILTNSLGRKITPYVLDQIEPTIGQAVTQIKDDPRLKPAKDGVSLSARLRLARFGLPLAGNVLKNMLAPHKRREHIVLAGEKVLAIMEEMSAQAQGDRYEKLAWRVELLPRVLERYLGHNFILFVSGVAAGMASWNLLKMICNKSAPYLTADQKADMDKLTLKITRGMPNNPTTQMDLALWRIAKAIRQDPAVLRLFRENEASELNRLYAGGRLPPAAAQEIDAFLKVYAGRGLGEIDMGSSRWGEDPTHVFEMLNGYLSIENPDMAPDVVFERSAQEAQSAIDELVHLAGQNGGGRRRARRARFLAGRMRNLMGLRESPKFFVVRLFWIAHRALEESGQDFVDAGVLEQAEDIFFLTTNEIRALAGGEERDWRSLVAARREVRRRELARRQIPRLLLSNGRAFYEGIQAEDVGAGSLVGSPVSPGSVQGRVRVVLDPRKAQLQSGEIMVCPGTDPSWTPLFLTAAGLVMETGGMMTHGAVVAREYGIPAIVGVDRATQRLKTGQLIRINGSSGRITLVEEEAS
ncbi:PEP/pyruvate-binding domain-containing protein [Pelolinea submarina]|uniref:Pyruvate,water dikinase n=1 Tax=Pelolinea submarina TaxID=913107 RepID=A0A347ZQV9_9CHLR|nr:PEP/pyruvate-binding domain-containing protein [Pelolinea submarina]REG11755.1 pyruvate,water dikinase [Pelolinea submarina]BBB47690.1 pyruvate, water dikinase [Pelolinea submarina]